MTSTSTRVRLFKNIFGEFWNCRLIVLSPSKTDFKSRAHFINGLFVSIWNTFRFAVRFVTFDNGRFWLVDGDRGGDRGGDVEIDLEGGDNLVSDISRPQIATKSGFDGEWLWKSARTLERGIKHYLVMWKHRRVSSHFKSKCFNAILRRYFIDNYCWRIRLICWKILIGCILIKKRGACISFSLYSKFSRFGIVEFSAENFCNFV